MIHPRPKPGMDFNNLRIMNTYVSIINYPFYFPVDIIYRGPQIKQRPCMDEQQAIAQLKNGNLAGLEFLVHLYQVQAIHTAYLITGDRAAAEDVVQTAFLGLIEKISQFDDQRIFRPWFLRSVVNASIKEVNRRGRNLSLDDQNKPIYNWLIDEGPRPEELAEANDIRRSVWNALLQLPPEQRAVIVQRHFLEMKEAEIVESQKRPASTIKWWLHMARNRLRTILSMHRDE